MSLEKKKEKKIGEKIEMNRILHLEHLKTITFGRDIYNGFPMSNAFAISTANTGCNPMASKRLPNLHDTNNWVLKPEV